MTRPRQEKGRKAKEPYGVGHIRFVATTGASVNGEKKADGVSSSFEVLTSGTGGAAGFDWSGILL